MGGRIGLLRKDHTALTDRLRQWIQDHAYKSREAFADKVGIPRSTAAGWFSVKKPSPELAHVLQIARSEHMNLNWLLLGDGPQLSGARSPYDKVRDDLRATIAAELQRSGMWQAGQVDRFLPPGQKLLRQSVGMWKRRLVRRRKHAYVARFRALRRAILGQKAEIPLSQNLADMGFTVAEFLALVLTPDEEQTSKHKKYRSTPSEKRAIQEVRALRRTRSVKLQGQ